MATRTPRSSKAGPAQSGSHAAVEIQPQVSETRSRPASPNGQGLITRIEEKKHLQSLNDRLANYIDTVRRLQVENQALTARITTSETSFHSEIKSVKNLLVKEVDEARKSLDKVSTEKARLQIDFGRVNQEHSELVAKFNKRDKDAIALEKRLANAENSLADANKKLSDALNSKARAEEARSALSKELEEKKQELSVARKQTEEETMLRIRTENELQTAREKLTFEESFHQEQLNQTRSTQVIEDVDSQLRVQYDQRLAEELQEIREQNEGEFNRRREELERKHADQVKQLRDKLSQKSSSESKFCSEVQSLKSRCDELTSQISESQTAQKSLQKRINDLQALLEQERKWKEGALQDKEREIAALQKELADQAKEYQELLDVKVMLDIEINTYRKLLEGEESRLSLDTSASPARLVSPRVQRSATKRKVYFDEKIETDINVENNSTGDVEISEHDQDGKSVVLFNKGAEDIAIGGWKIIRHAKEASTTYKVPRSIVIKAQSTVTVWSADTKHASNPPSDLIMKNQNWPHEDEMSTTLVNTEDEQMAKRESKRVTRTAKRRLPSTPGEEETRCIVM